MTDPEQNRQMRFKSFSRNVPAVTGLASWKVGVSLKGPAGQREKGCSQDSVSAVA